MVTELKDILFYYLDIFEGHKTVRNRPEVGLNIYRYVDMAL